MKNNSQQNEHSFGKIKTLVLSIVFAIILWVAIVNVVNPDVTQNLNNVRIQTNGVAVLREKGLVVVNMDELPSCSVKVRGKRKNLIESAGKIYAVVNVSDINRQGKALVSVIINSPSSVNVEKQSLSAVEVEVEPCYEKEIPIVIKQEGVLDEILVKSSPENERVKISGSKKDLEKISKCLITANLSEIVSDTNTMYPFVYLGQENEQIEKPETIYCSLANLLVYHTVYEKQITKPDFKIPAGLSSEFRTDIDIEKILSQKIAYGTKNNNIKLDKINYTLDVSDVKEGENKIRLKAEPVEEVYIPSNQLILNFTAKKLITENVEVSVTTENLEDGYEVLEVITPKTYSVTGTKEELSNVKAIVDLKGLSDGNHHIPLQFENKKLQSGEACFANVIIKRKED